MDTKVNYTVVGAFVVILSTALLLIGFWLAFGLSHKTYNNYLVYFNEAVNGLSIDAPVKYNGVTIGSVRSIELNPHNYNQVEILLQIDSDITIKTDTTATLMAQGLTGLNVINLSGGSPSAPKLAKKPGQDYPVIDTTPSLSMRLDTMIRSLSDAVMSLSGDIRSIMNPEARKNIDQILANLQQTTKNSAAASAQLPTLITRLNQTSVNLTQQTMPQLTETLNSVQRFSQHLDRLSEDLMENPSLLIRGRNNPPAGPGE